MDMKKNQDLIDENIAADEFEWVGQDKDAMNAISRESISFWKDSLRRLKQTKSALVLLTILIIITLCAIFIPMFYPIEQSVQHYDCMNLGMFSSCNEGGFMHIFGTDSLGRDISNFSICFLSSFTSPLLEEIFSENESGITDRTGYMYYDTETIQALGLEEIEYEFFVNIAKRSVVSIEGFNDGEKRYYNLEQVPDGVYNVEYNEISKNYFEFSE